MEQTANSSPARNARIAGLFYLGTIVFGALALFIANASLVLSLTATACYVAVCLLFYRIFKPVNRGVALIAAVVGLLGCLQGALSAFGRSGLGINSLAIFGCYCLLIGYLIVRSTFLPRVLGVLMAIGGVGWLTFALPSLSKSLAPFNMLPGIIAETSLTFWLMFMGVNEQRWREQNNRVN